MRDGNLRRFGATDLCVSPFGLGCARIGGIFKRDPADFVNLLSSAYDAGINFFDTADMYCQGESEVLVGRAFRHRRDRVIIATKAGFVLPRQRRIVARMKPLVRPLVRLLGLRREQLPASVRGTLAQDFSPVHLRRALEGSLRRLQTDRVDLFQLHSPPTEIIERGEWLETLDRLKAEGKIRYYAISCDTVEAGLAALRYQGIAAVQVMINLLETDAAERLVPVARQRNVAVIARECLANGLLIKDLATVDLGSYARSPDEAARRSAQLAECRRMAAEKGCSLPALALDYVSSLEGVSVSLVGVSTQQQLDALLAAGSLSR